ncbi:uncharacterized protein LOC123308290 [Coccinella septempunctata]|uniref:uncharacterized protein LOC123308290 n=1 Tax=Coccinella septempunctata TaxID=41139 RepID=UPI001D08CDF5|nr:uncharacterized protein LOC123308290 [Coccinella septempunctata]
MQQVTHRKMSFNYKFKNHHHNSLMLQEKLRESEWKRSKLEIEFNELIQQSRINQESDLMGYRRRYRDLLESEKYRIRRNEQLFAALKRLEMRISFLSETTEKYKTLRSKYRVFSSRVQRGRGVDTQTRPIGNLQHDRFPQDVPINNTHPFSSMESLNHPKNVSKSASGYIGDYSEFKEEGKTMTVPSRQQLFHKGIGEYSVPHLYESNLVQNKPPSMYQENYRIMDENIKAKLSEYPKISGPIHSADPQINFRTRQASYETPIDDTLPKSNRSYTIGNEDGFGRDVIEYSPDIRHRMANNRNDLSLDDPKYDFVDISKSDINKYAIGNPDAVDFENKNTTISKNGSLRIPETILKKYTNNDLNQEATKNYMEPSLSDSKGKQQTIPYTEKIGDVENEDMRDKFPPHCEENKEDVREIFSGKFHENRTQEFVVEKPLETKTEMIVEEKNSEIPNLMPNTNTNKDKAAVQNISEIEIIETQNVDSLREIKSITESGGIQSQSSLSEEKPGKNEEIIDDGKDNNLQVINKATEEVIEDLEFCVSNIDQQEKPVTDAIPPDTKRDNELIQKQEGSDDLPQNNAIQPNDESANSIPEKTDEKKDFQNATLTENMSQLNISKNGDGLELTSPQQPQEKPTFNAAEEDFEKNSEVPIDQDVSAVRQEETSEKNISNSHQNSQQETTQLSHQPEEHENSDESEMKKFKKQITKTQPEQSQYYDQNNQNYTVDEHGQHYDMNGHPISYDPDMPSGTQSYGPEYAGQYNEKGELVAPYDQSDQQYDQQYYPDDPNYANYDQYPQQYEDQQQYGEYDQEGYDPSQQGYDGSAQHGYDPNSQYNAYYAEVKYDQDPFYQQDTQESAPNPQHEENEEADKANRLMHMLESDTENSSRQEHKVTTESDFDFSNNQ